jgi:outer membrane biogenesis lipoprotein LolB
MASRNRQRQFHLDPASGPQIDVSLFDPLGQTVAEISVTPESATLTQANRAPRTAKDIDTLTRQALGWSLPVAGLRDWLQGYAVDADGKRFAASPANNSVFTSDGWRLRFVDWQDGPGHGDADAARHQRRAQRHRDQRRAVDQASSIDAGS